MLHVAVRVHWCEAAASGLRGSRARLSGLFSRALARWRPRRPEKEPVRSFSVPSGFSSTRPCLTIALTAVALIACSTAWMGTLLTSGSPEVRAAWAVARLAPIAEARQPAPVPPSVLSAGTAESPEAPEQGPAPTRFVDAAGAQNPAAAGPSETLSEEASSAAPFASEAAPAPDAEGSRRAEAADADLPAPGSATASDTTGATRPGPAVGRPPAEPRPASPTPSRLPARSDEDFAGTWATHERACSPHLNRDGFLPAVISSQGAWAGETTCSFQTRRQVGNTWTFAAVCSDSRRRWKSNVRMSVAGKRLTWSSERGSQTYVRCHSGLLEVLGRKKATAPV